MGNRNGNRGNTNQEMRKRAEEIKARLSRLTPEEKANLKFGKVAKHLRTTEGAMKRGDVPAKKKTKHGYKTPVGFVDNLQGVPGSSRWYGSHSVMRMAQAANTGTKVREGLIGLIASGRNANTTSTVHDARVRGLIK